MTRSTENGKNKRCIIGECGARVLIETLWNVKKD